MTCADAGVLGQLPLLVTADDLLLDDVLRLAAAAGTPLDVAHDAGTALRSWQAAAAVLVGADLVDAVGRTGPPRRDRVIVVARGQIDDAVFRAAMPTGAQRAVELPAGDAWLVEMLTDLADEPTGLAHTIGVVPGSGGVGATTFACALAATASDAGRTLLVDVDPLGPGVDRVVGMEDTPGVRWEAMLASSGRLGSRALREALPRRGELALVTWATGEAAALDSATVREVLTAGQRGHATVVVDLPRSMDEVGAEVALRCDRILVVAATSVPAVASAGRVVAGLRKLGRRLELVTRGGSGVRSEQASKALGLPLLAHLHDQRRLGEDIDLGVGPVRSRRGPLARAARAALAGERA